MEKILLAVILFLIFMVSVVALGALAALPLMLCWNYVMPHILRLPEIGFFQAWALMIVCATLFKSTLTANNKKDE